MASPGITIEIDGFDYLDAFVKNLDTIPIRKFLGDMMKGAKKIVQQAYSLHSFSGNTDFRVSYRTTKDSATLTVRGADVGFLEFGAGVSTSGDEFEDQVPYPVGVGSYSVEHRGQFANTMFSFWYYDRTRYHGIVATHGMQEALDTLRLDVRDYLIKRIASWIVNGK